MRMNKLALAVVVASVAAVGISGCNGSSKSKVKTTNTAIQVFDGYAKGCTVVASGMFANEVGGGNYVIVDRNAVATGARVAAQSCVDADTGAKLPLLLSVAQPGGAAVSPFSTLIVAAALAANPGADPENLTEEAVAQAKAAIVAAFELNDYNYDPLDPATANYVNTVASNPDSADLMQGGLALTTLLKLVSTESGASTTALAVLGGTIAKLGAAGVTIELEEPTGGFNPANPGASTDFVVGIYTLLATAAGAAAQAGAADEAAAFATFVPVAMGGSGVNLAAANAVIAIADADDVGLAAAIAQNVATQIDNTASGSDVNYGAIDTDPEEGIDVGTGGSTPSLPAPTGGGGGGVVID